MIFRQRMTLAVALTTGLAAASAGAQAVTVNPNGTLTASSSLTTIDNQLNLGPGVNGFNFSGATGSFMAGISPNGYYYADYLIDIASAIASSVTTTLTNLGGVQNLSERIYSYSGSFLGDSAVPGGALQVWSTDIPLAGASVSIVSPTALTTGQYVVELRGTTAGNYGGTLSLNPTSPVPEPTETAMYLAGLAMIGLTAARRRRG